MIPGVVTAEGEAIIQLELVGEDGTRREIETILDTGFNGSLTLPGHIVDELHLPLAGSQIAILADGSETSIDMHLARIVWHDDRERDVLALRAEGGPLVSMKLLHGNCIILDVIEDGKVSINEFS